MVGEPAVTEFAEVSNRDQLVNEEEFNRFWTEARSRKKDFYSVVSIYSFLSSWLLRLILLKLINHKYRLVVASFDQHDNPDKNVGFLIEYGMDKEHESKKWHYKKAVKRWVFLHVKNKMPVYSSVYICFCSHECCTVVCIWSVAKSKINFVQSQALVTTSKL